MTDIEKQHTKEVWETFWDNKRQIEQVYSNSDRILDVLKATTDVAGKYIMEVGAGSGRDGFDLAGNGAKVFFLDYADNALRIIRQFAGEANGQVLLIKADAFRLPFKDDSFDVVYHQGLLEHFRRPEGLLAENYRVVKKGGFALADVPQKYHLYTAVKHVLIRLNKWFAGWETEFSRKRLEGLFRRAGFSIHRTYGDWMRPSFFYRLVREVLKKVKVNLPLYPGTVPVVHGIRKAISQKVKKWPVSYYTFMDIGIIGKK